VGLNAIQEDRQCRKPEKESTAINASINEIKTIKPKGGKRPGAGRPRGVPNILTREIKGLAGQYGATTFPLGSQGSVTGPGRPRSEALHFHNLGNC
jgi:hypothetical protein